MSVHPTLRLGSEWDAYPVIGIRAEGEDTWLASDTRVWLESESGEIRPARVEADLGQVALVQLITDCVCPEVKVGGQPTGSRNLSPYCPVHREEEERQYERLFGLAGGPADAAEVVSGLRGLLEDESLNLGGYDRRVLLAAIELIGRSE